VSVVGRRTLDGLQAVNVTEAHDYVPSFIPQDERGPAYSRGFLAGLHDLRRDGLRTYTWSVRELVGVERVLLDEDGGDERRLGEAWRELYGVRGSRARRSSRG
jgi:hypothetical protein